MSTRRKLNKAVRAAVKAIKEDRWNDAHILAREANLLMDKHNEEHPQYPLGYVVGYRE